MVVTQVTVILRNEVDVDLGRDLDFVIKTWSPDTRSAVITGVSRQKKTTKYKNPNAQRDEERKRERAITRV